MVGGKTEQPIGAFLNYQNGSNDNCIATCLSCRACADVCNPNDVMHQRHSHKAAWNGLVHGRKRWLLVPPGVKQDSYELPAGQVPAFEWYRDSYPIWRKKMKKHLLEFYQEEGEVVYVANAPF